MVGSLRIARGLVLATVGALALVVVWDVATFGSAGWRADYRAADARWARS